MSPTSVAIEVSPQRLGARECPNCQISELCIEIKSIAKKTVFAELACQKCHREAVSEVYSTESRAIQQAIERWNSRWPDISGYLDADSEGFRFHGNLQVRT